VTGTSVAVLGTGSIGLRHLSVLRALGQKPIAVPVRQERAIPLIAEGWEVAASLDEAESKGARAAVIATDTLRHAADAEHALRLGLDVLCEKPLAQDMFAASQLLQLTEGTRPKLFMAYCLRFDAGLLAFRSRLGLIGEIHSVRIECRSFLPEWRPGRDYRESYSARVSEGGVLRDLSHEADYACWLFGTPKAVSGVAYNTRRLGIESEEIAEAFWVASNGAYVSIALDYLSKPPVRFVRAFGNLGDLEYDFLSRCLVLRESSGTQQEEKLHGNPGDIYMAQMRQFLQVVAGGDPGVLATGRHGMQVLALCDAWRKSASSGRQEKL
jgi:predicted dehydrogenase